MVVPNATVLALVDKNFPHWHGAMVFIATYACISIVNRITINMPCVVPICVPVYCVNGQLHLPHRKLQILNPIHLGLYFAYSTRKHLLI